MSRAASRPSLRDAVNELRQEVGSLRDQLNALAAKVYQRPTEASVEQGTAHRADRGRVELEWLSSHTEEIGAKYRGEAIAIAGRRVVASGPDMATVVRLATKAGHPNALFTAIPKDRPNPRI
jgi:hypothetical protein